MRSAPPGALPGSTGADAADTPAAALLEVQGLWGPARWTTTGRGVRINDGEHSVRNPANLALSPDRLATVSVALAP